MNDYQETKEWKALNHIWKLSSPEMRESASDDFRMLAEYIRAGKSSGKRSGETPAYLSELSNRCITFVLSNQPNIYHSIMSILDKHSFSSCDELVSFYIKKYGNTRPYIVKNKELLEEVASLCWTRYFQDGYYFKK